MFDFLYSEVWWMETITTSVITTAGSVLVAFASLVTIYLTYRKDTKSLDKNVEKIMEKQKDVIDNRLILNNAQVTLQQEHSEMLALGREINKTSDDTNRIVRDIKEEQIRHEQDYKFLSQDHKNMVDILNNAVSIANGMKNDVLSLQSEITQLKKEVFELKEENSKLRTENAVFKEQLSHSRNSNNQNHGRINHFQRDDDMEIDM